jgi:hypothetical protein
MLKKKTKPKKKKLKKKKKKNCCYSKKNRRVLEYSIIIIQTITVIYIGHLLFNFCFLYDISHQIITIYIGFGKSK